jgi:hypothetical protein
MEKDMDAEVEVRVVAPAEEGVAPAEALDGAPAEEMDVAPAEAQVDGAPDVTPVVEGEVLVGEGMTEEGQTMLVVVGGAPVGGAPPKHPGGFKLASIFTKGGKKVEVPQSHVEGVEQQLQHTFYCRPSFKPLIQGIIDLFEDKWTWMSCLEALIQRKLDSIPKPKDFTLEKALDQYWCPKLQLWHQCLPCLNATGSKFGDGLTMGHISGFCNHYCSQVCVMQTPIRYSNDNKNRSWQPIKRSPQPSDSVRLGVDVLPFHFPRLNEVTLHFRYFEGAFDCSPRWYLVQEWKGGIEDQEPISPICPQTYNLLLDRQYQERNILTYFDRMRKRELHDAQEKQRERDNVKRAKAILSHNKRSKAAAKQAKASGMYADQAAEYDDEDEEDEED